MYSVKANGNYNIIITDIGVTISSSNAKDVLIEKEIFESSTDAKKLIEDNYIIAKEVKSADEDKKAKKPENEKQEDAEVFIARKEKAEKAVEDVFVVEIPKETKEAKAEKVEKAEVTKVEETIEKTEATKSPVKKAEDKIEVKAETPVKTEVKAPVAKKEVTKRNNTNKGKK